MSCKGAKTSRAPTAARASKGFDSHRCLTPQPPDSLLTQLEIRALSVDDLSTARYVIATAFTRAAQDHYVAADIDGFADFVRSPHYGDLLLGNRAYGAWVGSEMVGVAAWSIGEGRSPTARLLAVFVHPLFSGNGIGTRLTEFLEVEAAPPAIARWR